MILHRLLVPLLGLLSSCASFEEETVETELTQYDPVFRGIADVFHSYDKLRHPFDREELNTLLSHPERDRSRLAELILRAAAEQDASFQSRLSRQDLREDPGLRPALAAYDYQINGDVEALELLAGPAAGPRAAYIEALSFIDEWTKSIEAIEGYETQVDGSRGIELASFWIAREQLFPEAYHQYKDRADIRRLLEKRLSDEIRAKLDARESRSYRPAAEL